MFFLTTPHELHTMVLVCVLFAQLLYMVDGNSNELCPSRFLVANTFGDISKMYISCFGVAGDCNVYYSPPGQGCAGQSLEFITTISANETRFVAYGFFSGSTICSNNQISAYVKLHGYFLGVLPRPTQAGLVFRYKFEYFKLKASSYSCRIYALAKKANVKYSLTTVSEREVSIDEYQLTAFWFTVDSKVTPQTLKIISDNRVIVSCVQSSVANAPLIVLNPITVSPILISLPKDGYVTVTASTCREATNLGVFFNVKPLTIDHNKQDCKRTRLPSAESYQVSSECFAKFTSTTTSNACMSILGYDMDGKLLSTGTAEPRLSSWAVLPEEGYYQDYQSHLPMTCKYYDGGLKTFRVENPGSDMSAQRYETSARNIGAIECSQPFYLSLYDPLERVIHQYSGGYQNDAAWSNFFASDGCYISPTEPPTEAPVELPGEEPPGEEPPGEEPPGEEPPGEEPPGEEPPGEEPPGEEPPGEEPPGEEPPGQPPSETPVETPTHIPIFPNSGAPSMTFCMNWIPLFALFGLNLFSSILV